MSNNKVYRILAVDDNREDVGTYVFAMRGRFVFDISVTAESMWQKLKEDSQKPREAKTAEDEKFDLLLLDLVLDPKQPEKLIGLELLPNIKKLYPHLPVIVVTNEKSWTVGKQALKSGAEDFFPKDEYDTEGWMEKFRIVIENSKNEQEVTELRKETQILKAKTEYKQHPKFPFIGVSGKIESIRKTLKTLAQQPDIKVLLLGETGVGKGVAARFMQYNIDNRRDKPFEDIHISTISKDLLESTLFGAKKGTFTGAIEDIVGRLELANEGTVFLDEIGELTLDNQIKLLQFLNDKKIRPLGGKKDILLDVHIISATNRDLQFEIEEGRFREDLYYRINDYAIEIPALRARREDIEPLMMHFFKSPDVQTLQEAFDPDLYAWLLEQCPWPGNIRQLEKVTRALGINKMRLGLPVYTFECLPEDLTSTSKKTSHASTDVQQAPIFSAINLNNLSREEKTAWIELEDIEKALRQTNGRKEEAAIILGLKNGDNIYTRIKKYQKKHPHLLERCTFITRYYRSLID